MAEGRISRDDPRAADVRELLDRHLAFAHEHSPPADVHALGVDGLVGPDVEFYSFRHDGELLGVGALKRLDAAHAELKSMHTAARARRSGVGAAMVEHLVSVARTRGYRRLSLETGSTEAFAPARALYARAGFEPCGPFTGYVDSPHSSFMTMVLCTELVFETHALTEDNERGLATGWLDGRLSAAGRRLAEDLGRRRRADGLAAVVSSDLGRARETVGIAFAVPALPAMPAGPATGPVPALPVFLDWRLRECDYGALNGAPTDVVHADRAARVDAPYPGGESWSQAVERVCRALDDIEARWRGSRVLVVGHVATWCGIRHWATGEPVRDLVTAPFAWQEGWEFRCSRR